MSFPPGTEIFQFPGFASPAYGFSWRYPKGVGCPIRTSTDQRLLAAPRGFSQRATSFIASWCQGIHRMPFSRSRTLLRARTRNSTMHRNQPQMQPPTASRQPRPKSAPPPASPRRPSRPATADRLSLSTQQDRIASHSRPQAEARKPQCDQYDRYAPLNAHARSRDINGAEPHLRPVRLATAARPETHQNLIHPDKDHRHPPGSTNGKAGPASSGTRNADLSSLLRDRPTQLVRRPSSDTRHQAPVIQTPPPRHHPGGDDRVRTDDPLLAKQVLSQLSYVPSRQARTHRTEGMVGQGGFEPPTPRLSSVCSNQLSY